MVSNESSSRNRRDVAALLLADGTPARPSGKELGGHVLAKLVGVGDVVAAFRTADEL